MKFPERTSLSTAFKVGVDIVTLIPIFARSDAIIEISVSQSVYPATDIRLIDGSSVPFGSYSLPLLPIVKPWLFSKLSALVVLYSARFAASALFVELRYESCCCSMFAAFAGRSYPYSPTLHISVNIGFNLPFIISALYHSVLPVLTIILTSHEG